MPPALCRSAPLGKDPLDLSLPGVMHQARLVRAVMGTKNQRQFGMCKGLSLASDPAEGPLSQQPQLLAVG